MNKYIAPEMELVKFIAQDIILTSETTASSESTEDTTVTTEPENWTPIG